MKMPRISLIRFVARTVSYGVVGVVAGMLTSKSAPPPSTTVKMHSVIANDIRVVDRYGKTRVEISAKGKSGAPMIVLRNSSGEVDAALVSAPDGSSGLMLVKPPSLHGVYVGFRRGARRPEVSIIGEHGVENILTTPKR